MTERWTTVWGCRKLDMAAFRTMSIYKKIFILQVSYSPNIECLKLLVTKETYIKVVIHLRPSASISNYQSYSLN